MALITLGNQNIKDTFQKIVQTDGTNLADGTGSILPISFNGDKIITRDDFEVSGVFKIPGFNDVSSSLAAAAAAGGDNLGNHTATQAINLDGNGINAVSYISASGHISSSTMSAITGSFDHFITLNTTIEFRDTGGAKVGDIKFHPTDGMRINKSNGQRNKLQVSKILVQEDDPQDGKIVLHQGNISSSGDIIGLNIIGTIRGGTF